MMEMSVESLARMNVNSRLRERAKIAVEVEAAGDVYRAAGKLDIAAAFEQFAESLRAGVGAKQEAKIAPTSPYGSNVTDVEPMGNGATIVDDGSGLPAVHLNDDETDAMHALRVMSGRAGGGGYAAGSIGAMMRD
jgi:hypothetical protein